MIGRSSSRSIRRSSRSSSSSRSSQTAAQRQPRSDHYTALDYQVTHGFLKPKKLLKAWQTPTKNHQNARGKNYKIDLNTSQNARGKNYI